MGMFCFVWRGVLSVILISFIWSAAYAESLSNESVEAYLEHLLVLKTSFESEELADSLQAIQAIPTQEAYEVVKDRLERITDISDVLRIPDLNHSIQLYLELFQTLGSQRDIDVLRNLADWIRLDLHDADLLRVAQTTIAHLETKAHTSLPSIVQMNVEMRARVRLEARNRLHQEAISRIDRFYQFMRKEVVGQENILRSLQDLYLKDTVRRGSRRRPEVFYFMGLPGNGKDTIAEKYVDALYGHNGAHEDHMFRMNIRTTAEAWTYFGSGKGYVGSGELPAFLRFLVQHSGGKYVLVDEPDGNNGKRTVVHENPDWVPGASEEILGPSKAVIFVNEAHDIPRNVKNNILKQAIERGIFPITNPGSGKTAAKQIQLPVTFIFATNEGMDLLEPRNRNGTRIGEPLSYRELHGNYERVFNDKDALKAAILKTNGAVNDQQGENSPGTSLEFLNRIPAHHLHILEPFSPEQLILIAKITSKKNILELLNAQGDLGKYRVEISEAMFEFLTDYKYVASENARPIEARLESYIFDPIYRAIRSGKIRASEEQTIKIDILKYSNGARSTIFELRPDNGSMYRFTRLIRDTLNDVPQSPLSRSRIAELRLMREKMLANVFGVEHIVDRLLEAAIVSESKARNPGESMRSATLMAFLGLSSTGKTETAKQYVKARYGDSATPVVIDFNGIQSQRAMEALILGSYDSNNNPIPSRFMKEYDKTNGNITFIFDEAANAPMELLKGLYEIFRVANPNGFTDGKARPMNNVTIILTGNAGEKIYRAIPDGLPKDVQERAMHEVFRIFLQDEQLQHRILLETFPEALLARLGPNVYHFGPFQADGKRQVAQLKLLQGIEQLRSKPSEVGWNISFATESDLLRLFDIIEREGFRLKGQGASIDKFVRELIIDKIDARLKLEAVENNDTIVIRVVEEPVAVKIKDATYRHRRLVLTDSSGNTYNIDVPVGIQQHNVRKSDVDRVLTAYHEAGHELVSNVFFGDRERAAYLSIIEGVALIGDSLVAYNGVRSGRLDEETRRTKEATLRDAAVLMGGYIAQQVVTMGGRHDSGKSNDMYRATALIQESILRYGLAPEWGTRAIPEKMSVSDYIDKMLTESDKELLTRLTQEWIAEADTLARDAIYVNFDKLFINMSKAIAENGQLHEADIQNLYNEYGVIAERDGASYDEAVRSVREVTSFVHRALGSYSAEFNSRYTDTTYSLERAEEAYHFLRNKEAGLLRHVGVFKQKAWSALSVKEKLVAASQMAYYVKSQKRDARLFSASFMPQSIANIERIISEERRARTEPVTHLERFNISEPTPVVSVAPAAAVSAGVRCVDLFGK